MKESNENNNSNGCIEKYKYEKMERILQGLRHEKM